MYDDLVLSTLPDKSIDDSVMEEENAKSLYLYDQNMLLKSINLRISRSTLSYYIENLKRSPVGFWIRSLRNIISVYSLNNLKLFLNDTERVEDLSSKIKDLLLFVKVDLIDYLFLNKFYTKNYMEKEEFLSLIRKSELNIPYLFKWVMVYIDKDSYDLFIKRVLEESSEESYSEEV